MKALHIFLLSLFLSLIFAKYDSQEIVLTSEILDNFKAFNNSIPEEEGKIGARRKRDALDYIIWAFPALTIFRTVLDSSKPAKVSTDLCNVHCVTNWEVWSLCPDKCERGSRFRRRRYNSQNKCESCHFDLLETERCPKICMNRGQLTDDHCVCPDGWTGECCEKRVTCPAQPSLEHGKIEGLLPYTVGSRVKLLCLAGYRLEGNGYMVCDKSGKWQATNAICKRVYCSKPTLLDDNLEMINALDNYEFGTSVYFTCLHGYRLLGLAWMTCGDSDTTDVNGKWFGTQPHCEAIQCLSPTVPEHGATSEITSLLPGTMITFSCDPGFRLDGSLVIACTASGSWSNRTPICKEIKCPILDEPMNGIWIVSSYSYGGSSRLECKPGYQPNMDDATLTCDGSGHWRNKQPHCVEIFCPDPGIPTNGDRQGNTFSYTSNVEFSCNPGYILTGNDVITCAGQGIWNAPLPECKACPENTYMVDATCTSCPENSHTVGVAKVNITDCICSQFYSGAPGGPCTAIHCEPLPPVANGIINPCDIRAGSECFIQCNLGFILVSGSKSRTCQANGLWDGEASICSPCPVGTFQNSSYSCLPCPPNTATLKVGSVYTDCLCQKGYQGPTGGPCTDINECLANEGKGPCDESCRNTDGSYECLCHTKDYIISPIDHHMCVPDQQCVNLTKEHAPANGALVCHWYPEQRAQHCAVRCNHGYEYPSRVNDFEYCGPSTNYIWSFRLQRFANGFWPCIKEHYQDVHLEAESTYLVSSCADLTQNERMEVMGAFAEKLNSLEVCFESKRRVCSISDVVVVCGVSHQKLKRRSTINDSGEVTSNVRQDLSNHNEQLEFNADYERDYFENMDVVIKKGYLQHRQRKAYDKKSKSLPESLDIENMIDQMIAHLKRSGNASFDSVTYTILSPGNENSDGSAPNFWVGSPQVYATSTEDVMVKEQGASYKQTHLLMEDGTVDKSNLESIQLEKKRKPRKSRRKRSSIEEGTLVEIFFKIYSLSGEKINCSEACPFLSIPAQYCQQLCQQAYQRFLKKAVISTKRRLGDLFLKRRAELRFSAAGRLFEPFLDGFRATGIMASCDSGMQSLEDQCVPCVAGTHLAENGKECLPCAPGTFQPLDRMKFCLHCPPGTTAQHRGSTSCDVCPEGFYGTNCTKICQCINGRCDPVTGRCRCHSGWQGVQCNEDIPGCSDSSCFPGVSCFDIVAPGTGYRCGPCPPGYRGDGVKCNPI